MGVWYLLRCKPVREPVRIELKPITLLFGPNSAGKSPIVHALHYAREVFESRNIDPGYTVLGGKSLDLGGFESLVHNHDKSLTKPGMSQFLERPSTCSESAPFFSPVSPMRFTFFWGHPLFTC